MQDSTKQKVSIATPMVIMMLLFFMMGFITAMNDILIPHLKSLFHLSYTKVMMVQSCFFGAYALMSLPMAAILERFSFKIGMTIGMLIAGVGCLLFIPAAHLELFWFFLLALFVLATGVVTIQLTGNPFVTLLGNAETASSRLTLVQAMNSLGTTLAPFFGAFFLLSIAILKAPEIAKLSATALEKYHQSQISSVQTPYLIIAAVFFVVAVIIYAVRLPKLKSGNVIKILSKDNLKVLKNPLLIMGAFAIFAYVGAEVSIGSFIVNYLGSPLIMHMKEAVAAKYVAFYWGGAMVGRFVGSVILKYIMPAKLLIFNTIAAIALLVIALLFPGAVSMWAVLLVGLFNSIQFPTIFAMSVRGLGDETQFASGVVCTAIVGGAIVPLIAGVVADRFGVQNFFVVPIVCYLYIMYFAWKEKCSLTKGESHV